MAVKCLTYRSWLDNGAAFVRHPSSKQRASEVFSRRIRQPIVLPPKGGRYFYYFQSPCVIIHGMDDKDARGTDGTADASNTSALGSSSPVPENPTPVAPTEGGIFSSSDTRIETENLPEAQGIVQQAPMSSITPALRTESTVTGDLKLGGTAKKKKWPLVVLVVAVTVVVGVGVWALISNQEEDTRTASKVKTALNQFSNYYLYGTDSTEAVQGNYDSNRVYKADTAMEERDIEFFNKAREYYDSFIQVYEQDIRANQGASESENLDDYLNGNVSNFTGMFDFIYRFAMTPALTSEEVFGMFNNTSFESAQQLVNNYYSNLLETTYEPGSRYVKERIIYDLAQVDQYHIYKDNNCLDGENIKNDCDIDPNKYDMTRIEEAIKIANSDILQLPDEVMEDSIEQLFLIQKEEL